MEPVSTGISLAAGIVQVVDATLKFIKYVHKVKEAPEEIAKLSSEAISVLSFLTQLRYRVDGASINDPWYRSVRELNKPNGLLYDMRLELERVINRLATQLDSKSKFTKFGRRMRWPFTQSELHEILERIERFKSLLGVALQDDTFKLSLEINARVGRVGENVTVVKDGISQLKIDHKDQKTKDLLLWISPVDVSAKHIEVLHKVTPGTCEWILRADKFKDWLSSTPMMLWCPGTHGAGKTVISAFVIDYLEKRFGDANFAIAYFYCDYRSSIRSASHLAASLLRQLLHCMHHIPQEVRDTLETLVSKNRRPSFLDYTNLLRIAIHTFTGCYICVDALDEHVSEENDELDSFELLTMLAEEANLMVTSLPLPFLKRYFKCTPQLDIKASRDDIVRYIESVLRESQRLTDYIAKKPSLEKAIKAAVPRKCGGMFLMANLHMTSLRRKGSVTATSDALKRLPSGLDTAYDEAMKRIDDQDEGDAEIAHTVIAWIVHASGLLTARQIQDALIFRAGDGRYDTNAIVKRSTILNVCLGVVDIARNSDVLDLCHYTAQAYFATKTLNRIPHPKEYLAEICLNCILWATGPSSSAAQSCDLLKYALKNWAIHAQQVENSIASQLFTFLEEMSGNVNRWDAWRARYFDLRRPSSDLQRSVLVFKRKRVSAISIASYFDLQETVVGLLRRQDDMSARSSDDTMALRIAAERGHTSIIRWLLYNRTSGALASKSTSSALHAACRNGFSGIVKDLLGYGADIEAKDGKGRTPLHSACFGEDLTTASVIVEHGADINVKDKSETSPLSVAVELFNLSLAQLLVGKGANVLAGENVRQSVQAAATKGESLLKALLEPYSGRVISYESLKDSLEAALETCQQNITRILCEVLDENTLPVSLTCTEIHWAVLRGDHKRLRHLLQSSSAVDPRDERGRTPLFIAIMLDDESSTITLLEAGANVSTKCDDQTPLDAYVCRLEAIARARMQRQDRDVSLAAEISLPPSWSERTLWWLWSTASFNYEIIKALLRGGAREHASSDLLSMAIDMKNLRLVECLLEDGAELNCELCDPDKLTNTNLYYESLLEDQAKFNYELYAPDDSIGTSSIDGVSLEDDSAFVEPGFECESCASDKSIDNSSNESRSYLAIAVKQAIQDEENKKDMVRLLLENGAKSRPEDHLLLQMVNYGEKTNVRQYSAFGSQYIELWDLLVHSGVGDDDATYTELLWLKLEADDGYFGSEHMMRQYANVWLYHELDVSLWTPTRNSTPRSIRARQCKVNNVEVDSNSGSEAAHSDEDPDTDLRTNTDIWYKSWMERKEEKIEKMTSEFYSGSSEEAAYDSDEDSDIDLRAGSGIRYNVHSLPIDRTEQMTSNHSSTTASEEDSELEGIRYQRTGSIFWSGYEQSSRMRRILAQEHMWSGAHSLFSSTAKAYFARQGLS